MKLGLLFPYLKRETVHLFAEVEATPQTKICCTDLPRTELVNKDATHSLSIIEVAVQRRCRVMRLGINHIEKLAPDFSEPPNSAAKILHRGRRFQIFSVSKKQNKMCF